MPGKTCVPRPASRRDHQRRDRHRPRRDDPVFNEGRRAPSGVEKERPAEEPPLHRPDSGLVNVLRTGEAETGRPRRSAPGPSSRPGPMFRDGELIGAVSVFQT